MRVKLVPIEISYQQQILEYKQEFIEAGDNMDGTAGLQLTDDFDEWLKNIQENGSEITVHEGFVPSSTLLAIEKSTGQLIGFIDIRHRLNEYLMQCGGHIGYSVRPSQRRQGYATEILSLGLQKCDELNISDVLVTCNQENIASAKTIMKNGGILENEIILDGRIIQRYWIHREEN